MADTKISTASGVLLRDCKTSNFARVRCSLYLVHVERVVPVLVVALVPPQHGAPRQRQETLLCRVQSQGQLELTQVPAVGVSTNVRSSFQNILRRSLLLTSPFESA